MKHAHLTQQRKHFVEAYCRLGNGTLAAKEAGYKDSPSLVNQASKLKRELSAEISQELTANFLNAAPKALSILMDLAENSASDSVKFQAAKDLLDRAGFLVLSIGEKRFDLNELLQNLRQRLNAWLELKKRNCFWGINQLMI